MRYICEERKRTEMFYCGTKEMKIDSACLVTVPPLVSLRRAAQSLSVLTVETENLISFLWSDT